MFIRSTLTPARLLPLLLWPALANAQQSQPAHSSAQEPPTHELAELVVSATRNQSIAGETPQKVTIITREQIEQQLAITQDPGQVLSNLIPSYSPSRQKLSNAGETFRGRSPLFLIDGVPQSNPLRDSARDSYTIDLSMIERIEVIHGASAEHGLGATGGIINYVTRRAESGSFNQHAGIRLTTDDRFESEGFGHQIDYRLSGQQDNWDYLAAVTRHERGVFFDGNNEIIGVAYPGELQNSRSYDVLAKVGYWLGDDQHIELSVNRFELEGHNDYVPVAGDRSAGTPTTARRGTPLGEPGYNEVTTISAAYSHSDWYGNTLDAQLYSQQFRAQFDTITTFPYPGEAGETLYDQTRNESDKLGAKFTLSRGGLWDDRLTLTTGVDLLQDQTRQMLTHTSRTYVPDSEFNNIAAFLQTDLDLTDRLLLQTGVRHEHAKLDVDSFATLDRSDVTQDLVSVEGGKPSFDETLFNAGLVFQVNDWAQLYANYSEGFGMPDVGRVLRSISTPNQSVDSLLQLEPIVTDNREIGARFDWGRYGLELSYYESNSDYGERLTQDNGVWVGSREKTEISGVEISGDMQVTDAHTLKASYTYAEGKSDTTGDGQVDTELTGINIAPSTLKLSWSAAWNNQLSSHLQGTHYFNRSVDDPELEFDGYSLVDAALTYQLPLGRASFGIENMFDRQYLTYYSQAARVSDDYYFTGRGRTFTLGYSVDF